MRMINLGLKGLNILLAFDNLGYASGVNLSAIWEHTALVQRRCEPLGEHLIH